MHVLILIAGLHLDDHVHCTLESMLEEYLSFPSLMPAAFKHNDNLVVPPLNKLVPGFILYGCLAKIH